MLESLADKLIPKTKFQNTPTKKILITLFVLFIFRFCNTIPLAGIDQEALKKSFFTNGK
jgi:preprotein translocase subunit SecY